MLQEPSRTFCFIREQRAATERKDAEEDQICHWERLFCLLPGEASWGGGQVRGKRDGAAVTQVRMEFVN